MLPGDRIIPDPAKLQLGREVRATLEKQATELRFAANTMLALPETRAEARKYLRWVQGALRDTDYGLAINRGIYLQRAEGIADVCRRAVAWEIAPNAVLDGLPISRGDAEILRRAA